MKLEPFIVKPKQNKTGYTGVGIEGRTGRYKAYIYVEDVKTHLGTYATKEEAALAYAEAKQRLEAEVS